MAESLLAIIFMLSGVVFLWYNDRISRWNVRINRERDKQWGWQLLNPLRQLKWWARLEDRTERARIILSGVLFIAMAIWQAVAAWQLSPLRAQEIGSDWQGGSMKQGGAP